jgi:hypothetical protein
MAEAITADLRSGRRRRAVRRVLDSHGGVDILVNNAGRSIRRPLLDRWSAGTIWSAPCAELLRPAAADAGAGAGHGATRGRPRHQRLDLGRDERVAPLFGAYQASRRR